MVFHLLQIENGWYIPVQIAKPAKYNSVCLGCWFTVDQWGKGILKMEGMRWAHSSKWSELHYKITSELCWKTLCRPYRMYKGQCFTRLLFRSGSKMLCYTIFHLFPFLCKCNNIKVLRLKHRPLHQRRKLYSRKFNKNVL